MVSSSSTTGVKGTVNKEQISYFERIGNMHLCSKRMIGFGISDKASFEKASGYAYGAIIGSAFIKALEGEGTVENKVKAFVQMFI